MISYTLIEANRRYNRTSEMERYLLLEGLGYSDIAGKHPNSDQNKVETKEVWPVPPGKPVVSE